MGIRKTSKCLRRSLAYQRVAGLFFCPFGDKLVKLA